MIVKTATGTNRQLARAASVTGLAGLLASAGIEHRSSSSTIVDERRLVGLPAVNLALRLAATGIGELELGVFRGKDEERRKVRTTWQSRFFGTMPNAYQSWAQLLTRTEASITGRNNAFWRLDVDAAMRVVGAHLVHADAMDARWSETTDRPEYRYRLAGNRWSEWTSSRIIHFAVEHVDPDCIIAPSPIELSRDTLAAALSKPKHARTTMERNGGRQIAVSYPESMKPEQAERYRTILEPLMTGANAAGNVRVFGGGPDITTIGLSLADMQFAELMQLDAELVGQLYGVPASLLGVMKNDRPLSPEHEETRWDRYYLGPRRTRIEETIRANPLLFGQGARDYPAFVTRPVRGDVKTQAGALVALVQAGILLPDDARAELGHVPLPGGLGQIPQVTPVGGAPNPAGIGEPAPVVVDENGDPVE